MPGAGTGAEHSPGTNRHSYDPPIGQFPRYVRPRVATADECVVFYRADLWGRLECRVQTRMSGMSDEIVVGIASTAVSVVGAITAGLMTTWSAQRTRRYEALIEAQQRRKARRSRLRRCLVVTVSHCWLLRKTCIPGYSQWSNTMSWPFICTAATLTWNATHGGRVATGSVRTG
jgi:hypothetical protein